MSVICQSAAYSRGRAVLSLRQAVVRLGLQGLRDVVLEAALHVRVFRAPGYEDAMARLARHSTAVARLMGSICGRARVDAEYAFLCGLLHDVGVAACLLALSDDARAGSIPIEVAATVVEEIHEEASGLLARLWDLPVEIRQVVASHHQLTHGAAPSPVKAALLLAEALLSEQELAPEALRLDAVPGGEVARALEFLRIDDATLATLRAEAAEVAAGVA
jgi:putative nucleotidyltransferase with HDIG domain